MTADLPALLQRAAQALPNRFARLENWPEAWWAVFLTDPFDPDGTGFVSLGNDARPNLTRLLEACWAECEARNLAWTVGRWMVMGPPYAATVTGALDHYEQYGASPAEALLLALLEAVEAGE